MSAGGTGDAMTRHFNCPHCGAPGHVPYGEMAQYTCTCRFQNFTRQSRPLFSEYCIGCGQSIRPGQAHVCMAVRG
jgi:hypothetical protein